MTVAEAHYAEWFAYFTGLGLNLGVQYMHSVTKYLQGRQIPAEEWFSRSQRRAWKIATIMWMFQSERSTGETIGTWVTTFGVAWLLGGWVVAGGALHIMPNVLQEYIHPPALAFTLGSLMQWVGPYVGERLARKLVALFGTSK